MSRCSRKRRLYSWSRLIMMSAIHEQSTYIRALLTSLNYLLCTQLKDNKPYKLLSHNCQACDENNHLRWQRLLNSQIEAASLDYLRLSSLSRCWSSSGVSLFQLPQQIWASVRKACQKEAYLLGASRHKDLFRCSQRVKSSLYVAWKGNRPLLFNKFNWRQVFCLATMKVPKTRDKENLVQ